MRSVRCPLSRSALTCLSAACVEAALGAALRDDQRIKSISMPGVAMVGTIEKAHVSSELCCQA
jgi:hypothetical protein